LTKLCVLSSFLPCHVFQHDLLKFLTHGNTPKTPVIKLLPLYIRPHQSNICLALFSFQGTTGHSPEDA